MFVPKRVSLVASRVIPGFLLAPLRAVYTVYHRRVTTRLNRKLLDALVPEQPGRVQTGPFKGMIYGDSHRTCTNVSKWLGAYECELHSAVERLLQKPYPTVINIGCAEGYYAVGLALRLPRANVIAFDLDPSAAEGCRELARLNGVDDRVQVRGRCSPEELRPLTDAPSLIFCDCEGAERVLLDPAAVPGLRQADLVVELHDFVDPAISPALKNRFAATHQIGIIGSVPRDPAGFPQLAKLSPKNQGLALEEFRPGRMEWAIMQAKGSVPEN